MSVQTLCIENNRFFRAKQVNTQRNNEMGKSEHRSNRNSTSAGQRWVFTAVDLYLARTVIYHVWDKHAFHSNAITFHPDCLFYDFLKSRTSTKHLMKKNHFSFSDIYTPQSPVFSPLLDPFTVVWRHAGNISEAPVVWIHTNRLIVP